MNSANIPTLETPLPIRGLTRIDRPRGWEGRLIEYIGSIRGKGFRWGTLDCGGFALGAVHAMVGLDYHKPVQPYRSMEQLYDRLLELGYDGHIEYIASIFPDVPPMLAMPGDLALTPDGALGVFQGASLYQMSPSGLGLTPRSKAIRAFIV